MNPSGKEPSPISPGQKVLLAATVYQHLANLHIPFIRLLKSMGCEVHLAACPDERRARLEEEDVILWDIPFSRNPLSISNLRALRKLTELMKNQNYKFVHINTPIAAVIGRFAAALTSTPVIYMAHGFHFYRGASGFSAHIYYLVERLLSPLSDCLIVVNEEDRQEALRFTLRNQGPVFHVPGVGVDIKHFGKPIRLPKEIKHELGLNPEEKVVMVVAEMSRVKNHIQVFKAFNQLLTFYPRTRLILAGDGTQKEKLQTYAVNLGIEDKVIFLGFRDDIPDLLSIADVVVLTSFREGLCTALVEAMAAGCPLIGTDVRGIRDLISEGENGFLVSIGDADQTTARIIQLLDNEILRYKMGAKSREKARAYDVAVTTTRMREIYGLFLS
ncbi:MAG: glycosyltransferase family 4 protein [Chitinophagales bacterium]